MRILSRTEPRTAGSNSDRPCTPTPWSAVLGYILFLKIQAAVGRRRRRGIEWYGDAAADLWEWVENMDAFLLTGNSLSPPPPARNGLRAAATTYIHIEESGPTWGVPYVHHTCLHAPHALTDTNNAPTKTTQYYGIRSVGDSSIFLRLYIYFYIAITFANGFLY